MIRLQRTLLQLGDQTSKKLGKAYEPYPTVRMGEEAITEHNLLTIAMAHPEAVRIQSFGKREEARNGADREWIINGSHTTSRLRVQAKRVSRDGFVRNLDYHNRYGSQLNQLIKSREFRPIVCFYATTCHRTKWIEEDGLSLGCLFADARKIKKGLRGLGKGPKTKFSTYEDLCYPWHRFIKIPRVSPGGRSIFHPLNVPSDSPDGTLGLMSQGGMDHFEEQGGWMSDSSKQEKLQQGVIGRITINLTDRILDKPK